MSHRVEQPIKPLLVALGRMLLAETVQPLHFTGFLKAEIFAA